MSHRIIEDRPCILKIKKEKRTGTKISFYAKCNERLVSELIPFPKENNTAFQHMNFSIMRRLIIRSLITHCYFSEKSPSICAKAIFTSIINQ